MTAASAPPLTPPASAVRPAPAAAFDIVRVTPHGRALFAGHAPPGSTVGVWADGRALGTARADGSGSWLLLPRQPLPPGPLHLRLRILRPLPPAPPGPHNPAHGIR